MTRSSPLRPSHRWTLFLLSLFACTTSGWSATYYVSTTGSDANAGTLAAPFASLQKAITTAVAGDTILVRDGVYGPNGNYTCGTSCSQSQGYSAPAHFVNSGTAAAPITIQAEHRLGATIDCGLPAGYSGDGTDGVQACDTAFDFQGNASYINIRDFEIRNAYWTGVMINGNVNTHIEISGNHIHHIGNRHYSVPAGTESYGIVGVFAGTGTSDIRFDRNSFHHIGRLPTSGQSANDYNHDHGLYVYGGPYTITNNLFYSNTAGWGVQISPGVHDVTLTNNTFAFPNPAQDGHIMLWSSGSTNKNITIQNNLFYQPLHYAIGSWEATEQNTLIDHNIVYGSGVGLIDQSQIAGTLTISNNRLNTDPLFTSASAAAPDFHLKTGSPAIDTGATVAGITTDFDSVSRPQGPGFDLGAYEVPATVVSAPVITSAASAAGRVGTAFSYQITASGNPASYGATGLPAGLAVNATTGLLTGTPSVSGTFTVTLSATNSGGTGTAPLTLSIAQAVPVITSAASASATVGTAFSYQITASGSPTSYGATGLPTGLSINTVTGLVTGTPSAAGTFTVTLSAANSSGTGTAPLSLSIAQGTTSGGPIGLWQFNEGAGLSAFDSSGNNNTLTLLSGATWLTDTAGVSLRLPGSPAYAYAANPTGTTVSSALTVMCWINPTTKSSTGPRVIEKQNSWYLKMNGGQMQLQSGSKYARVSPNVTFGKWQHVAFTFSQGAVKAYFNGVPVSLAANTFALGDLLPTAAGSLFVGVDPAMRAYFKGALDDLRIYDRALSDSEIASSYGVSKPLADIAITQELPALNPVSVFPNPWRAGRSVEEIKFANLPSGSTVKIFTVSARWVRTLQGEGTVAWNGKNDAGESVASGIYLYVVETPNGERKRGKLAIIR